MVTVRNVKKNGVCEFMNTLVLQDFVWSVSALKINFYCICWVRFSFYDEIQS
jgi:hypothetical protein